MCVPVATSAICRNQFRKISDFRPHALSALSTWREIRSLVIIIYYTTLSVVYCLHTTPEQRNTNNIISTCVVLPFFSNIIALKYCICVYCIIYKYTYISRVMCFSQWTTRVPTYRIRFYWFPRVSVLFLLLRIIIFFHDTVVFCFQRSFVSPLTPLIKLI